MKILKTTLLGLLSWSTVFFACASNGEITFESEQHYLTNAGEVTESDWLNDFFIPQYGKDGVNEALLVPVAGTPPAAEQIKLLRDLHYYLRLNHNVDLDHIDPNDSTSVHNPANVNRVIRLMPKANFEAMFTNGNSNPGEPCSYLNFLKAVALLPGLFSDYMDPDNGFERLTGLEPTEEMKDPDKVAIKILSAIMANAVQETSSSGSPDEDGNTTMESKIPGTFGTLEEQNVTGWDYNSQSMGPFNTYKEPYGPLAYVAQIEGKNINYYGRGVHQITYAINYANNSLFLYGDLRLVRYPELLKSNSILPWLTTLVYFAIPQARYPSIAEIFDGQWKRHVDGSNASENIKTLYIQEFPMCVLCINGGIECGDAAKLDTDDVKLANNNTKIRGNAYKLFVENNTYDEKRLFAGEVTGISALTGDEVLTTCKEISQKGIQGDGGATVPDIAWRRYFFLAGVVPSETATDWMAFAGNNVLSFIAKPQQWNAQATYSKGSVVFMDNDTSKTWAAKWDGITGGKENTPGSEWGPWADYKEE
jgi:hypothetical protein